MYFLQLSWSYNVIYKPLREQRTTERKVKLRQSTSRLKEVKDAATALMIFNCTLTSNPSSSPGITVQSPTFTKRFFQLPKKLAQIMLQCEIFDFSDFSQAVIQVSCGVFNIRCQQLSILRDYQLGPETTMALIICQINMKLLSHFWNFAFTFYYITIVLLFVGSQLKHWLLLLKQPT